MIHFSHHSSSPFVLAYSIVFINMLLKIEFNRIEYGDIKKDHQQQGLANPLLLMVFL